MKSCLSQYQLEPAGKNQMPMPQILFRDWKKVMKSAVETGHQISTGNNQISCKSNNTATFRKIRPQIDVYALKPEDKAQAYEVEEALETTKIWSRRSTDMK